MSPARRSVDPERPLTGGFATLLLPAAFVSDARGIMLADGLTHTLSSGYASVLVYDGPGPTTTTVTIEDGAS